MKRFIAIFLLIFFVFSQYGHFALFKLAQVDIRNEIKNEIKAGISDQKLLLIRLAVGNTSGETTDFKWKGKNELWYKGGLFDVVKRHFQNDTLFLYCLNDKQEELLFANLGNLINCSSDYNNLIKNLNKIINQKTEQIIYFAFSGTQTVTTGTPVTYFIPETYCSSARNEVPSPPPKV